MDVEPGRFEVKLAETTDEVRSAQRLRYQVFVEEMGADASPEEHEKRLEFDSFDPHFDHLILIDRQRESTDPLDRVVGAYRLMQGHVAKAGPGFYGASEYDLGLIEALNRKVVELGRSCVHAEVRGGAAVHILWNALAEYVVSRDIEIMFGVASFHGTDPNAIGEALSLLHHKHLAPEDIRVKAREDAFVDMNRMPLDAIDRRAAGRTIPSLIKAYLRLGGFVGEGAYIDHAFNTIDICLLMDTTRMASRYLDYYKRTALA
jgi:putative hemolysin